MIELFIGSGMTAILLYGKPTKFIRIIMGRVGLETLSKCALCMGFWVGVIMAIIYQKHILYPFAIASFSWLVDAIVNSMRENYIK